MQPIILSQGQYKAHDVEELKKKYNISLIYDIFEEQLNELFEIENPSLRLSDTFSDLSAKFVQSQVEKEAHGDWIYFPWSNILVHTIAKEDYWALRTNRNKNLITHDEQKKLADSTIGILGLSIGSHIAINLAYAGIANTLKLAEFDTLATSNLNRIKAKIYEVGKPKIEIAAHTIYELNPYAHLILFNKGLNTSTLTDFITGKPAPQIIFDAIDDFEMKIRVRLEARKAKIPVVMLTSLGDQLLVDIERYDIDQNLPLFNGRAGNTPEEILSKQISEADKKKYAVQIVGRENVPERAIHSLGEINKTLVGRPQLLSTVIAGSGFAVYIARQLLLGASLPSGRKLIQFSELLKFD